MLWIFYFAQARCFRVAKEGSKDFACLLVVAASNWLKLNTNGAANGTLGSAGDGGFCSNCRGFIRGCFMLLLGSLIAFEVELMTTIFCLKQAMYFGWDG